MTREAVLNIDTHKNKKTEMVVPIMIFVFPPMNVAIINGINVASSNTKNNAVVPVRKMSGDPHCVLIKWAERLMASMGPRFSMINTGITKYVAIIHERPPNKCVAVFLVCQLSIQYWHKTTPIPKGVLTITPK